jgi:hypothetical protein
VFIKAAIVGTVGKDCSMTGQLIGEYCLLRSLALSCLFGEVGVMNPNQTSSSIPVVTVPL